MFSCMLVLDKGGLICGENFVLHAHKDNLKNDRNRTQGPSEGVNQGFARGPIQGNSGAIGTVDTNQRLSNPFSGR